MLCSHTSEIWSPRSQLVGAPKRPSLTAFRWYPQSAAREEVSGVRRKPYMGMPAAHRHARPRIAGGPSALVMSKAAHSANSEAPTRGPAHGRRIRRRRRACRRVDRSRRNQVHCGGGRAPALSPLVDHVEF